MASYSTGSLPVATTDRYPDPGVAGAAALLCPHATAGTITVSTAAVAAQFGRGLGGAPVWEAVEHFYAPGVWAFTSREGIDAVRVRSATPATPATVAISAYV
jgi:hypothetical protein